jgi:hypothetical protein
MTGCNPDLVGDRADTFKIAHECQRQLFLIPDFGGVPW